MGRKIPEIITEAELHTLLAKTNCQNHRIAYLLGFYQGMRISEIVGLKKPVSRCCQALITKKKSDWKDDYGNKRRKTAYHCSKCDKEWKQNEVRRHKTDWQIEPLQPKHIKWDQKCIKICQAKGDKDRVIPIMIPKKPNSRAIIKVLKKLPVSCGGRALEHAFRKQCKEVLNKTMHFHCLRHSGASYLVNDLGWNTRHAQEFLGHSKIDITEQYLHVTPQNLVNLVYNNGGKK